jgi:hypothetical protein
MLYISEEVVATLSLSKPDDLRFRRVDYRLIELLTGIIFITANRNKDANSIGQRRVRRKGDGGRADWLTLKPSSDSTPF